jgi:hypothetical protein
MTCEIAQQNITLAQYGELPDELQFPLEQHLAGCEDCRHEWHALIALHEDLSVVAVAEPSPNLLTASRMRLEEALDNMPPRSALQRLTANGFRWISTLKGAPALATLLLGFGFIGGTAVARYEEAQVKHVPPPVIVSGSEGAIASVSGIVQTPNSELVQVKYNRLVPESVQGSLDDPQIRELLMMGTKLATTNTVHADSVALLAGECAARHNCEEAGQSASNDTSVTGIRSALLASLRYDKSSAVRLKALNGLQPYVAQDAHVRDAVLEALMHDSSSDVRVQAVSMLQPVQADSSVRQVLRTVSTQDVNPAIRDASFNVLQGASDIQ